MHLRRVGHTVDFNNMGALLSCLVLVLTIMFGPVVQVVALSDDEKKSIYQDSVHYDRPDESNCTASDSIVLPGNNNIAKAFNFLSTNDKGPRLPAHQAAGIVGNLIGESSVFPTRKQYEPPSYIATMADINEAIRLNKEDSSKGYGIGIAQWTSYGRLENLKKAGDPLSLDTQLLFLVKELEAHGMKELKQANDVRQATWIFLSFFERPGTVVDANMTNTIRQPTSGGAKTTLDTRTRYANEVLGGNSTGNDSASSDSSSNTSLESADCGDDSKDTGVSFRIGSFNVLGSGHTATYKDRADKSIRVIQENMLDVVGLQEFMPNQRDYFMPKLTAYDNYPKGSSNEGHRIENSIIWNKEKFDFIEGGIQPNLKYFCGSNLDAPWVKLKDLTSAKEIFVLNTHDPANGKSCGGQSPQLRHDNALQHVKFTASLQNKYPDNPIFMTGDFNSGFDVVGINKPLGNKAKNLTYCILNEGGVMQDAYDLYKKRNYKCPNPKPKADRENDSNGIDHVFVSKGTEVTGYDKVDARTNGADHPTQIYDVVIPNGGAGEGEPDFNKKYSVKYDDASGGCKGGQTVGAQSLSDVVMKKYSPPVTSVGGYSCRANTADSSQLSIHAMGRALDIMIDGTTPKGRETGDKIRNFMINNAEELGVQGVIWNKHIWSVNHKGWRDYISGPNPHTDHLHVEINVAASKKSNLGKGL